jgi:hypothetical protein
MLNAPFYLVIWSEVLHYYKLRLKQPRNQKEYNKSYDPKYPHKQTMISTILIAIPISPLQCPPIADPQRNLHPPHPNKPIQHIVASLRSAVRATVSESGARRVTEGRSRAEQPIGLTGVIHWEDRRAGKSSEPPKFLPISRKHE